MTFIGQIIDAFCRVTCFIRREFSTRRFGFRVLFDSVLWGPVCRLLLHQLKSPRYAIIEVLIMERRKRAVEKHFNVRFDDCTYFPPDMLWQDYSRISSFIPTKDSQVIDVGANIGDWAVVIGKYHKANVVAIEPIETAFDHLTKNIKINSIESRVVPINAALGEKSGMIALKIDTSTCYASTPDIHNGNDTMLLNECFPVITMDSLISRLGLKSVDLVKIDVEGSEYGVLKGSCQTLTKFKPKLIVEIHSVSLKKLIIEFLYQLQYNVVYEKVNFYNRISVLYFEIAS